MHKSSSLLEKTLLSLKPTFFFSMIHEHVEKLKIRAQVMMLLIKRLKTNGEGTQARAVYL